MKKFEVPIKDPMIEFTLTQNLWLTFNNEISNLNFKVSHNKDELLLLNLDENYNPDNHDKILKHQNELEKTLEFINSEYIYFNTYKNIFKLQNKNLSNILFYKRNEKEIININSNKKEYKIDFNDIIIVFNDILNQKEIRLLMSLLDKYHNICYSILNIIVENLKEVNNNLHPLIIIDISSNQSYKFSIKSSLKTISLTIDMIKNKVLKYRSDKIWQIETVIHEALVNAITYGNELDYDKDVFISYEIGDKGLRIFIRDVGEGFDVHNISVPVGVEALQQISGRGIYIMKKFSNAMFYNNKGTELLLFFDFLD